METSQGASSGVFGAIKGALNLFSSVNKAEGVSENLNPQPIDEYESSYTEVEITQLVDQWKRTYKAYYSDVEPSQTLAFEYWIGKQRTDEGQATNGQTPLVDNKIFESIETFIPIATRANPDPLVQSDPNELGQKLSHDLKLALVHEADRQKLRKILKRLLRHWIIYRIGVLKLSYNLITEEIETVVVNPKRIIFDKDGHIDEAGLFTGEYIGEKKQATASTLIQMFPKKATEILMKAQQKKGTKIEYFEWWYRNTDVFYTLDDMVLGKFKNPHWNYDIQPKVDPMTGQPIPGTKGTNHFKEMQAPYIFLSIFSTGLQPHDETSLVLQNIGIQDMINRRYRQIDDNVKKMNNGIVVSDVFTDAQASQAASALARGTAIRVPDRDVNKAVMRLPAPAIPSQVFEQMNDGRDQLANIFGTSGSTPQGIDQQESVRGKILVNQMDSSRIGGGITEFLEQIADTWYNFLTQFMFVHYTDEHYIVTAGSEAGQEIITIKNTMFQLIDMLDITVKEGSLIPKDPLTQRNEAIDLWSAGAIDPLTFYKRLEFSDPAQATNQLILWQMLQKGLIQPQQYLPSFQVAANPQMNQPDLATQGVGGPAVNPIGQQPQQAAPAPGTPPAVQSESKQLLQAVPIS